MKKDIDIKIEKLELEPIVKFSDELIEAFAEEQIEFLKLIHPCLEEKGWKKGAIEIRCISRNEYKYKKSLNLWNIEEDDRLRLVKYLKSIAGQEFCIYNSLYTLDYDLKTFKEDGSEHQKGYINTQNAISTQVLPIDFDNMNEYEFNKYKDIFNKLEIEHLTVSTGHGYQVYILLDRPCEDKSIFSKFTKLLLKKGIKCDSKIKDSARIFRLPNTLNLKGRDKKYPEYYGEAPPLTEVKNWTSKRYDVEEIFNRIEQNLQDSEDYKIKNIEIDNDEIIYKSTKKDDTDKGIVSIDNIKIDMDQRERQIEIITNNYINIDSIKDRYKYIKLEILPSPIQKILCGAPKGTRNESMWFMIPFLRNALGLTNIQIRETLVTWGGLCSPSLEKEEVKLEVNRMLKYKTNYGFGEYTENLKNVFGEFEPDDFGKYSRDKYIKIENVLFTRFCHNKQKKLSDGAIVVFLKMLLLEHLEENITIEMLVRELGKTRETIRVALKELEKEKYIKRKDGNRKNGEESIFSTKKNIDMKHGFTLIESSVLELCFLKLDKDYQIIVYMYMLYMLRDSKDVWASQKYLGEQVSKSQNRISEIIKELQDKKMLKIKKIKPEFGWEYNNYILKY